MTAERVPGEPDHVTRLRDLEERLYRLEHAGGGTALNLRDLADTNVAKATNGQTLGYDKDSGLWKALPLSDLPGGGGGGGGGSLPCAIGVVSGSNPANEYQVTYPMNTTIMVPLHDHPLTRAESPFSVNYSINPAEPQQLAGSILIAPHNPGIYHIGINMFFGTQFPGDHGLVNLLTSDGGPYNEPRAKQVIEFVGTNRCSVSISTVLEVSDRVNPYYIAATVKNSSTTHNWFTYDTTHSRLWAYQVAAWPGIPIAT